MVHKIFGWFLGILYVKATGREAERFVNLCRNHGIILWGISFRSEKEELYFYILLKDFYKLRRIVKKSKVFPVVIGRRGFPFFLQYIKKHLNFAAGVTCCFFLWILLSTRIWSIEVSGESYHTKESLIKYLNSISVYGGMAKKDLSCKRLRETIRKKYPDIGWISVEESGSKIHIRIKEVQLKQKKKKEEKGHLIAETDGKVVSIVTRAGTAKVKAGKKVKKGKILISGVVKILGDGGETVETDYVHADGTVVLKVQRTYKDLLQKEYQKKIYTGREKRLYECRVSGFQFFFYNPLKNLESYEKYDIIRDGGVLYEKLSKRFPVQFYRTEAKETRFVSDTYGKDDAEKILSERYADYLGKMREKGYVLKKEQVNLRDRRDAYYYEGTLVFYKTQEKYRTFQKGR